MMTTLRAAGLSLAVSLLACVACAQAPATKIGRDANTPSATFPIAGQTDATGAFHYRDILEGLTLQGAPSALYVDPAGLGHISVDATLLPTNAATASNQAAANTELTQLHYDLTQNGGFPVIGPLTLSQLSGAGLSTANGQATSNGYLAALAGTVSAGALNINCPQCASTGAITAATGALADIGAAANPANGTSNYYLKNLLAGSLAPVLPTGAATAGNQTTANAALATIATNTTGAATAAGQATGHADLAQLHADLTVAGGIPVLGPLTSAQLGSAGLASATNQGTQIAAEQAINTKLGGTLTIQGSVTVANQPASQAVTAVAGGIADLGTGATPAANTVNANLQAADTSLAAINSKLGSTLTVTCASGCSGGSGGGNAAAAATGGAVPASADYSGLNVGGSIYGQTGVHVGSAYAGQVDIASVGGMSAASGLPVTGSVTVSNLPATQTVSGSVAVTNLPATQAISGAAGALADIGTGATPAAYTSNSYLSKLQLANGAPTDPGCTATDATAEGEVCLLKGLIAKITSLTSALGSPAQAGGAVATVGTNGSDYSANKPSVPNVGAAFGSSGPYANYVLVATVPANAARNNVAVENDSGGQVVLVRDDGTAAAGSAPANATVFPLIAGQGAGQQGGGWASTTFKGRIQVYAPASTAQVAVFAE